MQRNVIVPTGLRAVKQRFVHNAAWLDRLNELHPSRLVSRWWLLRFELRRPPLLSADQVQLGQIFKQRNTSAARVASLACSICPLDVVLAHTVSPLQGSSTAHMSCSNSAIFCSNRFLSSLRVRSFSELTLFRLSMSCWRRARSD